MDMKQRIQEILTELDYLNNPYFKSLHDGTFEKEDFIETQIQFFYAVDFFARPMAVLAAKIPTAKMRLEIVRNIWEEHGEGDLSIAHSETFLEFLNRLGGIAKTDIENRALWPEVRIFNTTLTAVCTLDDYMTGIGAMGIIEYMFSDISATLGKGIIKNDWLTSENIVHYKTHEILDVRHADDFFNIVKGAYKTSPENRYYIDQGFLLGATLFHMMYYQLYNNRKRRMFRDVSIPHSRAEGAPCA